MKGINRRTIIKGSGLILGGIAISSCVSLDKQKFLEQLYQREQNIISQRKKILLNLEPIYRELPSYVYSIEFSAMFIPEDKERDEQKIDRWGMGIILNNHLITSKNLVIRESEMVYMFTGEKIPGKLENQKMKLEGKMDLTKILTSESSNLSVFKLPEDIYLPNFPDEIKFEKNIYLGQEIFVITPQTSISNPIQKGIIYKSADKEEIINYYFNKKFHTHYGAEIDYSRNNPIFGAPIIRFDGKNLKFLGIVDGFASNKDFSKMNILFQKIINEKKLLDSLKSPSKDNSSKGFYFERGIIS